MKVRASIIIGTADSRLIGIRQCINNGEETCWTFTLHETIDLENKGEVLFSVCIESDRIQLCLDQATRVLIYFIQYLSSHTLQSFLDKPPTEIRVRRMANAPNFRYTKHPSSHPRKSP